MNHIIIVAGGKGERLQSELPKQFIKVKNLPIIAHTIKAFLDTTLQFSFIIVCNKNYINNCKSIVNNHFKNLNFNIVEGGKTRFDSVLNGLNIIVDFNESDLVAIHDAVRPFVSTNLIKELLATAKNQNCAIPATEVSDSIYQINEKNEAKALQRNTLKAVQTPQCFNLEMLKKSYQTALDSNKNDFTDDASVWNFADNPIKFIAGETNNIKITYPKDLIIADLMLQKNSKIQS